MKTLELFSVMALSFLSAAVHVAAQDCSAAGTVATGGSAGAGGTSASTLGTAGSCQTDSGTSSSIGSGGSAAADGGNAMSKTHVNDNVDRLKAQTKAQAVDKGSFSKSRTKTTTDGDTLQSTTRTMSHEPGQKPVKDTTQHKIILPEQ